MLLQIQTLWKDILLQIQSLCDVGLVFYDIAK